MDVYLFIGTDHLRWKGQAQPPDAWSDEELSTMLKHINRSSGENYVSVDGNRDELLGRIRKWSGTLCTATECYQYGRPAAIEDGTVARQNLVRASTESISRMQAAETERDQCMSDLSRLRELVESQPKDDREELKAQILFMENKQKASDTEIFALQAEMKMQLEAMKQLQERLTKSQSETDEKVSEIKSLRQTHKSELDSYRQENRSERERFEQERYKMDDEIRTLRSMLASTKSEMDRAVNMQIQSHEASEDRYAEEIRELASQVVRLEKQLAVAIRYRDEEPQRVDETRNSIIQMMDQCMKAGYTDKCCFEEVNKTLKQYGSVGSRDIVKMFNPIQCSTGLESTGKLPTAYKRPSVALAVLRNEENQVTGVLTDIGVVPSNHPFDMEDGYNIVAGTEADHENVLKATENYSLSEIKLRDLLDQTLAVRNTSRDPIQYVVDGDQIILVEVRMGANNRIGRFIKRQQSARPKK